MRSSVAIHVLLFIALTQVAAFQPSHLQRTIKHRAISKTHLNMFATPGEVKDIVEAASSSFILSEESTYSSVSLYFTLALYVLTLPGLYSLVTRSAKGGKAVQKTYDIPGPANPTAKSTRQTAGEVMAYFKAMNYQVATAEDVITFKGVMGQSKSQAAFLTFCTFMGLGSFALVMSILLPDVGVKAYALCLLSPYAGIYYWNNSQRIDEVKIKMETSDDEQITSIIAEGGKEDLERFSKALLLPERGKVYIKGIFDEGMGSGLGSEAMASAAASENSTGVPSTFKGFGGPK